MGRQEKNKTQVVTCDKSDAPWIGARMGAFVTALFCLAIYTLTLCPSVPGGDGAELITASYTLAVAHPPGYPLYTLLGKLFTYIPHGSIAWRVNLFSAVCDSAAAAFVFLIVVRITKKNAAGFLSAALFAFSPLIWRYAVIAEVFALNNLFVAVLFYLALCFWEERKMGLVYVGALVLGLGLSNHHTLIFYAGPLTLWVFWIARKELWNPRRVFILLTLFFIGLVPYVYLVVAGSQHRLGSWGETETLRGFLHHFLRKDYSAIEVGSVRFGSELALYGTNVVGEFLYIGPILAVVGLFCHVRRKGMGGFVLFSFGTFIFYIVAFNSMANFPIEKDLWQEILSRFWQQANVLISVWIGLGVAELISWIPNDRRIFILASQTLVMILAGLQVGLNYKKEDQSRNRLFQEFGMAVLQNLPKDSMVITRGDVWVNTIRYLQLCENVRPDVACLDAELLQAEWFKHRMAIYYPAIVIPGRVYRAETSKADSEFYSLEDIITTNLGRRTVFVNRI